MTPKPLPNNEATERQVIEACLWMTGDEAITLIATEPDSLFHHEKYRHLWSIMRYLASNRTLESMAFLTACRSQENGETLATEVLGSGGPVSIDLFRRWLSELRGLAHKRALAQDALALYQAASEEKETPNDIEISITASQVKRIRDFGETAEQSMQKIVDAFDAFCQTVRNRKASGSLLKFGIAAVDRQTLLVPSYGLVLARTSHGKTALAATAALSQSEVGCHPVYFSLEQPGYQLAGRFLSLLLGKPLSLIMASQQVSQENLELRQAAMERLATMPLTIVDGRHTLDSILATSLRLRDAGRCDIIYIDQMSRVDHQQQRRETKEQAWTRSSSRIADMWKLLNVPVVLLAQLNVKDSKEHPEPSPSHIKDCGSLLEDSCWQMLLDRPEADPDRFAKMESKRKQLEHADENDAAQSFDFRGKVKVSCCKDRNSIMGGTWSQVLFFDHNSGRIHDGTVRTEPESDRFAGTAERFGPTVAAFAGQQEQGERPF